MGNKIGILKKRKSVKSSLESKDKKIVISSRLSKLSIPISTTSAISVDEYLDEDHDEKSVKTLSSVTVPSIFVSHDGSIEKSISTVAASDSVNLNHEQLESVYFQYKINHPIDLEENLLSYETSSLVKQVLDTQQSDMIFKFDTYINAITPDLPIVRQYAEHLKNPAEVNVPEMFVRHYFCMLIANKMCLDYMNKDPKRAKEFIRQLAISHALLNVTPDEFKTMDLHVVRTLLQRNLINDESIVALVGFIGTISDEMVKILNDETSKVRDLLATGKSRTGKDSCARENYRCMKKWRQVLPIIQGRVGILLKQTKIQKIGNVKTVNEEEVETINTQELKEKDYIMKLFSSGKKRVLIQPESK